MLLSNRSFAQISESFENSLTSLSSNCWQFTNVSWNNTSPIAGIGSASADLSADMRTPYLNITSTSFTVSFKYELTAKLSGTQTRTIQIGIVDVSGNYTSLQTITLDKNSPTTVQSFSNTYTLASTGVRKLVINVGGSGGGAQILLDDLSSNASFKYGPANHCNSAPVANKDTFYFTIPGPYVGNVITNDSEPDGETLSATVLSVSPDGTVIMNTNGTFSFVPNPGFTGTESNFTYQICDGGYEQICAASLVKLYFQESSPAPLPVKLISFQGNMNNSKVSLSWSVAENESDDHFEIEKSSDGKAFSTAGIVAATNKAGAESYSYNEIVNTERVYYRLKMYDKNQVINYSKILAFQTNNTNSGKEIKIINNPATDKLTLSLSSVNNQSVEIKLFDMNGRMQMNQRMNVYQGNNIISVALNSAFKTGIYAVEVTMGSERQTAKFVKQ